jgi:hypothetical protein
MIRCNKNNIFRNTSYVNKIYGTRKCMIFTDTIQHYKFLRKNLILWFELFFFKTFFGCNVPPFGILDKCSTSFDFNFNKSETVDMPTQKSAAIFHKMSPFLIRLTASNFCPVVITTCFHLADTFCNHRQTKC